MDRILILIGWICLLPLNGLAQLKPGFDPKEARDMIMLCTTYTFQDLYGSDAAMVPQGYERVYTSVPTPLDNKFDIFRKGDLGVIVIRGSTGNMLSWLENVYSAMLPAKGEVSVDGKEIAYRFADDTAASVHAGYTLAIATISDDVLHALKDINRDGVRGVIITGHSQGGALAHLLRAYLEHLPRKKLPRDMRFKTYAFASPMVGNQAFSEEYERSYATKLSSFSVVNPEDAVPRMPFSYKAGKAFSVENLMGMVMGNGEGRGATAMGALMNMFGGPLVNMGQYMSANVGKRISEALGKVEMPAYRDEMNYAPLAKQIDLEPFAYPLILADSTMLANDMMRAEPRDANGAFVNKDLYRKAPGMFQHKPYNYYVSILERYFPDDYQRLHVKVLPENL